MGKRICLVSLFLFFISGIAAAGDYRVQRGETLSEIAHRNFEGRVYGASGSMLRLMRANPQIKDRNKIYEGQLIRLEPLPKRDPQSSDDQKIEDPLDLESSESDPLELPNAPSERFSVLALQVDTYYTSLDGQDKGSRTSAKILSDLNYALRLNWSQHWSARFYTYQFLGANFENYNANASSAVRTKDTEQTLSSFGLGAYGKLSEDFSIQASFSASKEVYYRGVSTTEIQLESLMHPKGILSVGYEFLDLSPFRGEASVGVIYLVGSRSAVYETKPGTGYRGEVNLTQDFESLSLKYGLHYQEVKQDTSLLELKRRDLGMSIGINWRLGK